MISMTHVDNYCHALLLAGACLEPGSKVLGKFYIATDGGSFKFWRIIDEAVTVRRRALVGTRPARGGGGLSAVY